MKYRKKPIVVEAFKWTGGPDQTEDPEWVVEKIKDGTVYFSSMDGYACVLCIKTLEGTMTAIPGDYIIKGLRGELYPCKPDIFDASYESAETECPTIEPPQGKWKNGEKDDYPHCTNCDYMPMFDRHIDDIYYSPFCPNCGAKMEDI